MLFFFVQPNLAIYATFIFVDVSWSPIEFSSFDYIYIYMCTQLFDNNFRKDFLLLLVKIIICKAAYVSVLFAGIYTKNARDSRKNSNTHQYMTTSSRSVPIEWISSMCEAFKQYSYIIKKRIAGEKTQYIPLFHLLPCVLKRRQLLRRDTLSGPGKAE